MPIGSGAPTAGTLVHTQDSLLARSDFEPFMRGHEPRANICRHDDDDDDATTGLTIELLSLGRVLPAPTL